MMMEAVLYISIRWHEPDLSSADLAYNMALAPLYRPDRLQVERSCGQW